MTSEERSPTVEVNSEDADCDEDVNATADACAAGAVKDEPEVKKVDIGIMHPMLWELIVNINRGGALTYQADVPVVNQTMMPDMDPARLKCLEEAYTALTRLTTIKVQQENAASSASSNLKVIDSNLTEVKNAVILMCTQVYTEAAVTGLGLDVNSLTDKVKKLEKANSEQEEIIRKLSSLVDELRKPVVKAPPVALSAVKPELMRPQFLAMDVKSEVQAAGSSQEVKSADRAPGVSKEVKSAVQVSSSSGSGDVNPPSNETADSLSKRAKVNKCQDKQAASAADVNAQPAAAADVDVPTLMSATPKARPEVKPGPKAATAVPKPVNPVMFVVPKAANPGNPNFVSAAVARRIIEIGVHPETRERTAMLIPPLCSAFNAFELWTDGKYLECADALKELLPCSHPRGRLYAGLREDGSRYDLRESTVCIGGCPYNMDEHDLLAPLITFNFLLPDDIRNTAVTGVKVWYKPGYASDNPRTSHAYFSGQVLISFASSELANLACRMFNGTMPWSSVITHKRLSISAVIADQPLWLDRGTGINQGDIRLGIANVLMMGPRANFERVELDGHEARVRRVGASFFRS